MKVIDQINGSALFAQSAYSASIATKDSLGRDITSTYLTEHQDLSNYATTGDLNATSSFLSGAIDYVSANAGDEFPASANDAITAYQNASGTYLTAHQSLSAYLTKTSADTLYQPIGSYAAQTDLEQVSGDLKDDIDYISGVAITAHQDLSNYATTSDLNTASSFLSGAIDYVSGQIPVIPDISATEWNSVYETVETNSGSWAGGTSLTGDAQGAVDEVYANSGKWITSSYNGYIKTTGFTQSIKYGQNALYFSAYKTGNPGITLYGNQGSAFYKENQLQLTRDGKKISFNIGGSGSTITADAAQTTGDGGIHLWNKNNSAYYNQNGIKLMNSATKDWPVPQTAFIGYTQVTSWNDCYNTVQTNSGSWTGGGGGGGGDMSASLLEGNDTSWQGDASTDNSLTGYNGSAFGLGSFYVSDYDSIKKNDGDAIIEINNVGISFRNPEGGLSEQDADYNGSYWRISQENSTVQLEGYKDEIIFTDANNHTESIYISSVSGWNDCYNTVQTNSGSWTGGGGGSIDTIPFIVQSPLTTGISGSSAYIGLTGGMDNTAYVPYSALSDYNSDGAVHEINGSAIYAMTANWSNNCDYAQTAYCDGNGNTITEHYQPTLSFSYDENNKISAINSSALAGGSSITSGLELSAGDGISITDDLEHSATIIACTAGGSSYTGDAQGALDQVYTDSGHWNESYAALTANSGTWGGGSTGDYVPYSGDMPHLYLGSNNTILSGYANTKYNQMIVGTGNNVKGTNAFVFGNKTTATAGSTVFSLGNNNGVGSNSFTFGNNNNNCSNGVGGFIFGSTNIINGNGFVVGERNRAEDYGKSLGAYCSAYKNSICIGYGCVFSGKIVGNYIYDAEMGLALGRYNSISADAALVIGNGSANSARSDSFVVYRDGSVSAAGKISANGVELGVDETVLWSGTDTSATQTLSENITAFEEIKVYGKSHNKYPWISQVWVNSDVVYGVGSQMWWNSPAEFDISRYCLSGDKIIPMKGSWYTWANGSTATTGDLTGNANQVSYICKVIGINRKA